MASEDEDQTIYDVVVNHEEQYSIWPSDRDLPAGWRREGTSGPKAACLDHIEPRLDNMRRSARGGRARRRCRSGPAAGRRRAARRAARAVAGGRTERPRARQLGGAHQRSSWTRSERNCSHVSRGAGSNAGTHTRWMLIALAVPRAVEERDHVDPAPHVRADVDLA